MIPHVQHSIPLVRFYPKKMTDIPSKLLLPLLLALCMLLSGRIFFLFHPDGWPNDSVSAAILGSTLLFGLLLLLSWHYRKVLSQPNNAQSQQFGLYIGLLWTLEIAINNFVQPALAYRDNIDNGIWAIITLLILAIGFQKTLESGNFRRGVQAGFWSGLGSGVLACLSALLLINFAMNQVCRDPLNIKEWQDIGHGEYTHNMAVYFAYQSYTGAVLHLYLLGMIWGLLFGALGAALGLILSRLKSKTG